jgi:hypothetical protein
LEFFDLDLFVFVFISAPHWVFIKFVFGLEIIRDFQNFNRDFQNFNRDFVWKIWLIANFAECGSKPWKGYLITVRTQIFSFFHDSLKFAIDWIFHTKSRLKFWKSRIIFKPNPNLMKTQRGALLNTKTNKFGLRVHNESYYMLFIFIFWYERKSLERDQPNIDSVIITQGLLE